MGVENVFPKSGFTVTNDLYLSPTTAAPTGSLVDDDVEINNSAGKYGIDNIITVCAENTVSKGFGFVINFGHNSPGSYADTTSTRVVTKDGWYRFVFYFTDIKGDAYLNEAVYSESTGKAIAWSGRQAVGGGAPGRDQHVGRPWVLLAADRAVRRPADGQLRAAAWIRRRRPQGVGRGSATAPTR